MDVALVTCSRLDRMDAEDAPLRAALSDLDTRIVVWDDPSVEWAQFRITVVRSTWDYVPRRNQFVEWAERVASVSQLWNPPEVIRWNTHKSYLRDLERSGVRIVPTEWAAAGAKVDLRELLSRRGWTDAVVKPAVDAGALGALRVHAGSVREGQAHLDELLLERDVMVQPYLPSVETLGERSLIMIEGDLTHAVRKRPALQPGMGHTHDADSVAAEDDERALAREALRHVPGPTLYARVDIARDARGAACLMELEVTEPCLYFTHCPAGAERLAAAIRRRLRS